MSWIKINKSRIYAALLLLVSTSLCLHATAQTLQFATGASAIYGTVTNATIGPVPAIVSINPIAQSIKELSGSNDTPTPSATQTINGVIVYNLSSIDDGTSAANAAITDYGTAFASSGPGSLLNGLVTWENNYDPVVCLPNAINPAGQTDCTSNEAITNLTIGGVAVPAGVYPAGTVFPVIASFKDANCAAGADSFVGYLIMQESKNTGQGTNSIALSITGLHLVGQATCSFQGVIAFFNTYYDLHVLGPVINLGPTGGAGNVIVNETANLTLTTI